MNSIISDISRDILDLAPEINSEIRGSFRKLKMGGRAEYEESGPNPQDITTELDHTIGLIYIDRIYKKYKDILTIDSEEESERVGDGKITLRFDPLDGTKHFFKGIPILASTVALVENNITEFSMVLDIFPENIYYASRGQGAYLNDRKIGVSSAKIKDDLSFVMTEAPNSKTFSSNQDKFTHFTKNFTDITKYAYRTRNLGLGALSVCYVADGSCPAYVDFSGTTKLYDVEAAAMIALEAGAVVGDINGNKCTVLDYDQDSEKKKLTGNLLVANPVAFEEISELLSS